MMRLHKELFEGIQPRLSIMQEVSVGDATDISNILFARPDLEEDFLMMVNALNIVMCSNDDRTRELAFKTYNDFKEEWRERINCGERFEPVDQGKIELLGYLDTIKEKVLW